MKKIFNYQDDTPALILDNGSIINYRMLNKYISNVANTLEKNKLSFLLCNNNLPSIVLYLSIIKTDGVVLLLSSNIEKDRLEILINDYRPFYVMKHIKYETFQKHQEICNFEGYVIEQSCREVDYNMYPKLRLLLSTSGSIGSPKCVRVSDENLIANTVDISEYLKITESSRAITTLPMSYTYGLSIINTHLYNHASLVITDKSIIHRHFWSLVKKFNVTNFGGIPFTYQSLLKLNINLNNYNSLKYVTQAGGKLENDYIKRMKEVCGNRIQFVIMYGQTEATARMTYLPSDECLSRLGSIGKSIPHGKIILTDIDGTAITQPYREGEITYTGPNVSLGYAQNYTDLNKGDDNLGTLWTGDIAYFDYDGYYYITGRKKRFIKIYGNRINIDEVENELRNLNVNCVCVGNDKKIIIFYEQSYSVDIVKLVSQRTKIPSSLIEIRKIEKIIRKESGKIDYSVYQVY